MNSFRPPAPSVPRLTRRTLLRGLGGAAALVALPAPRCLAAEEAGARARRGSAPLKITRVRTILTAPQNRIRLVVVKVETSEPGLYGLG
jgi:mannonate dehydratase